MEGIVNIQPKIDKILFLQKGKMNIYLQDGRIIIIPLNYFSDIKKLSTNQQQFRNINLNFVYNPIFCKRV